ncbi:MAG: TIGR03067 domain-containing protein [Gemmataceae bacterium]
MRLLTVISLMLITLAPSWAGEAKVWEGQYKPVSIKYEDAEQILDKDAKTKMTLVVKDGEYRMYWQKDDAGEQHIRLFTADANVDSKSGSFTLTIKDGAKKGQQLHGIYELNKTELKLCYGPVDKPRPTSFSAAKGSGCFLEVWSSARK